MSDESIINQINDVLETLRPAIKDHGGDIELVSFKDGIVSVRLHGACIGCPLSFYTLKLGLEEQLKDHIPDIQEVIAID